MADALADVGRLGRAFNIAEDGPEVFIELRVLLGRIPVACKQVHEADFRRFGTLIEVVGP